MKHTGNTAAIPVLYNYYAGHDNNRDSFMNALPETTNMSRIMYREWFPQIMYNHHQTGPRRHGDVRAAVPRSVQLQLPPDDRRRNVDLIGVDHGRRGSSRKASRASSVAQGRQLLDVVERRPAHDGLLPQPDRHPDRDDRQPDADAAFRSSRRFVVPDSSMVVADHAAAGVALPAVDRLLDHRQPRGARLRVALPRDVNLYRIYQMGEDNIKWGNEDHWTHHAAQGSRRSRRPRAAPPARRRRRRPAARRRAAAAAAADVAAAAACPQLYAALHDARSIAIRAASSCRPTARTSARRCASSTR